MATCESIMTALLVLAREDAAPEHPLFDYTLVFKDNLEAYQYYLDHPDFFNALKEYRRFENGRDSTITYTQRRKEYDAELSNPSIIDKLCAIPAAVKTQLFI